MYGEEQAVAASGVQIEDAQWKNPALWLDWKTPFPTPVPLLSIAPTGMKSVKESDCYFVGHGCECRESGRWDVRLAGRGTASGAGLIEELRHAMDNSRAPQD